MQRSKKPYRKGYQYYIQIPPESAEREVQTKLFYQEKQVQKLLLLTLNIFKNLLKYLPKTESNISREFLKC